MISRTTVSTRQKVKKKRPSRFLARNQKTIRLGRESVTNIAVAILSAGRMKVRAVFAAIKGSIVVSEITMVFFPG